MTTEQQNEQQEIVKGDKKNDWTEQMHSDFAELMIIYDFLKIQLRKWNHQNPGNKKHINIRDYYYTKKEKVPKTPKPKKYTYIRKTTGVECKNSCGTQVHVPLEEYQEGNQYTCAMCERIDAFAYKRGRYQKLKSKNVDPNNEIDVETTQLLNFEPSSS